MSPKDFSKFTPNTSYRLCGPGGPLVLTEDGELRAMLALPQVYLSFGADAPVRAGYVAPPAGRRTPPGTPPPPGPGRAVPPPPGAMLALPQVYLSFGADAPVRAGYVYALACAPARRGEGWASAQPPLKSKLSGVVDGVGAARQQPLPQDGVLLRGHLPRTFCW